MLILQEGAKITFTAATLYGPLLLISFLYLPTLIYITFLGVRFYGWRKWLVETLNDPVYFVFPFLTSMSFYGEPGATSEDGLPCSKNDIMLNNMNTAESNPLPSTSKPLETNSKEDIELDIFKHESDGEDECDDDDVDGENDDGDDDGEDEMCDEKHSEVVQDQVNTIASDEEEIRQIEVIEAKQDSSESPKVQMNFTLDNSWKEEKEMTFSLQQSNTLYLLFLLGSTLCIVMDIHNQGLRSSLNTGLSPFTTAILIILPINILLWVDFIVLARNPLASGQTYEGSVVVYIAAEISRQTILI